LVGFHKENIWFNISRGEYGWAMKKRSKYIIAHIYIDEKGPKPQFTLTEFVDPAGKDNSLLNLSMWYSK
jgi:hypothetical protein